MTSEYLKNLTQYTKKLTLLYVEDDEKIVSAAMPILKKFFDKIVYARDGKVGVTKFNENHIDLIFTDINMPNLNGLDMLTKIQELDKNVPAVIMSAHKELEYYQNAIELNVAGYIVKPTSIADIIQKIDKIVAIKKEEEIKTNKFNFLVEANKKLIDIGYQISTQKDHQKLLEIILLGAKDLSNADGGTLYLFNKQDDNLEFKIVLNNSLDIQEGGTKGDIAWPALNIYNNDKTINQKNVAVVCAIKDKLVNINDIYQSETFDFSGAKNFDLNNDYKTTSMLVIPMRNRENELVGVIQLINKLDENNNVVSFNSSDESLITSMASQASMMLENNKLVDDLEALLYSLIKSIGSALSAKSSYTAKHIDNVAKLTEIIANGVNNNNTTFNDISFNSNELEEIKLAALLHDIGKISTPVHIVDKRTKLEAIYDRIESIKLKFELVKKDIEILHLKNKISDNDKINKLSQVDKDFEFIKKINLGNSFMSDANLEQLDEVSKRYPELFTKDELYHLSIRKGTLSKEDREIINNHVIITYNMLKEVPFPKKYSNVPKIAGSHHITVDGRGYAAYELMDQELTIQDKILAIADIFEALSAVDRPYRDANTLNQIAKIFNSMVKNKDLDKDLVKLFFEEKLYLGYVQEHFTAFQMDEITEEFDF